jgi:hypothetical protein
VISICVAVSGDSHSCSATPADFKAHYLQGRLLAVTCSDSLRALAVLQGLPRLSDVTLYGDALHVLTGDDEEASIASALTGAGLTDVVVQPIAPTLEDVFISLMRRRD